MSHTIRSSSQQSYAAAVSRVIRESRRRQKLTQAELAHRTGGLVTKAALANYETGHRSLRIDVVWVLAGALGENLGALMTTAQTYVLPAPTASTEAVIVDVADLLSRNDPQLAAVRRWFEMRRDSQVTLNNEAITALARLMDVSEPECRRIVGRSRLCGQPAVTQATHQLIASTRAKRPENHGVNGTESAAMRRPLGV